MKSATPLSKTPSTGKRYWRSLGELDDSPAFREWLEREFPEGASEMEDSDASRRSFLKLMGASTALAGFGMSGCRRPEAYLVPYTRHVEWVIPGKPLLYTTAMPRVDGCTPIVATTHEGRPTKLDGNPLHPINNIQVDGEKKSSSGSDSFVQATILDLYDPDRSKYFKKNGKSVNASDFTSFLEEWKTGAGQGEGAVFVVGESTSPTRARLISDLRIKFPQTKFFRYEPFGRDNVRAGLASYFGRENVSLLPQLDKATRVLSLDCDFLGLDRVGGNAVQGFTASRRADRLQDGTWQPRNSDEMSRLYVLEPGFSVTGGMADHRGRLAASQIGRAARWIAAKLGVEGVTTPSADGLNEEWLASMVEDLQGASGKSVVMAGSNQPAEVHALAAAINEKLGAFGKTLKTVDALVYPDDAPFAEIDGLGEALKDEAVNTVFFVGEGDPVFDAPDDFRFSELLSGKTVVHLGPRENATAAAATWHVPGTHFLESWGDVRAADGTYSVVQPMINPLYGGWSENDLYLRLLAAPGSDEPVDPVTEDPGPGYAAVRETFTGDDTAWNRCLRDGFQADTAFPVLQVGGRIQGLGDLPASPGDDALEVRFVWDSKVFDGRYVNNGWLQETPDPVTTLTWENTALFSVATFRRLGLKRDGDRVKIAVNGREGYFAAQAVPGLADNTISLAVGYGQRHCGRVGYGVGTNAYALRTLSGMYFAGGATVERVTETVVLPEDSPRANAAPGDNGKVTIKKWSELAVTQEHNSLEGRAIARDGQLSEYEADDGHDGKSFIQNRGMDSHIPPDKPFYKPEGRTNDAFNTYDSNHQWAMTIDLNQCVGCTACMVACQAENNIPIVGKRQVLSGREMAWIRMDRYFADADVSQLEVNKAHSHDPAEKKRLKAELKAAEKRGGKTTSLQRGVPLIDEDNVEMISQPMACQQCESASCEVVCPVNATVHSDDGLNTMAYNRCIGTRYCANNCPYKARRFNFFDYNKRPLDQLYLGPLGDAGMPESMKLQKNPNVTVRMRGVMEKCTYCVQRIETAKIAAKAKAGDSADIQVGANAIRTACQEACPADAVVFGNLNNADDDVNKLKSSPRDYQVLKYIGNRPRTSYLARIKNPNPKMPGGAVTGQISRGMH